MRISTALTWLGLALLSSIVGCGSPNIMEPLPQEELPIGISAEKIGDPSWEIADMHQVTIFQGKEPESYDGYYQFLKDVLAPPNHKWVDDLGIGPGDAHEGPYDHEMADGIARLKTKESDTFKPEEVTFPNTFMGIFMVVASEGSPTGSSPDFAEGPIMPSSLFPMSMEWTRAYNGVEDPEPAGGFFIPALDKLEEPYMVEGHSHYPLFFPDRPKEPELLGHHEWALRLVDIENNGWTIYLRYKVTE
jgi:hypothetical protein